MRLLAVLLALVLAPVVQAATPAVAVHYTEFEPDGSTFVTRYVVTARHVRMDTGDANGDFTLFDRKTRTAYNVVHGERRVLVISPLPVAVERPEFWSVDEEVKNMANGGKRFIVSVNGNVCATVIADPRAVPEASQAIAELRLALAPVQAETWSRTPPELRSECDLAVYGLEVQREFAHGLPLMTRYFDGRRREYDTHETTKADAALFRLPRGYSRTNLRELPGPR